MSSREIIRHVMYFVLFLGAQWLVLRQLNLFGVAFCFSYIGAVLLLPIKANAVRVMLLAFAAGLATDMFYNSPGMHASAAVLLAFIRPAWLRLLKPAADYEEFDRPSIRIMGFIWFVQFTVPLLFIHHFMLFMLEYLRSDRLGEISYKALASTVFTWVVMVIIQLMYDGREGR